MKKTKIVCTLGPSCCTERVIQQMIQSGMNVARVNMSHNTHGSHQSVIDAVKNVRQHLNIPIAIMVDTKGPEIRVGVFKKGKVELKKGDIFTLTSQEILGNKKTVSLMYKNLPSEINVGARIFANNGMMLLEVISISETDIVCKVKSGGELSTHKGLNISGFVPKTDFISEFDKQDLKFAIDNKVDYIASSFVSNATNVCELRNFLDSNGGKDIKIISKIENAEGLRNIKTIIGASDGIMIARGDLGVEMPLEKIPHIQKRLINLCNAMGKPVIVATEMLESMTYNLRPTRAEVSDVATSIYDQTSCTMLSGETAVGKHPVSVVKMMEKIIAETEKNINFQKLFENHKTQTKGINDTISESTCQSAINVKAKAIVVWTQSGKTAFLAARFHTPIPIIAVTNNAKTYNSLSLGWNIYPILLKENLSEEEMIKNAPIIAEKYGFAKKGDIIVSTSGTPKKIGQTNSLKIINI